MQLICMEIRQEVSEFILRWTKGSKAAQNEMQRASFRLLQNFPPSLASIEKKTATLPIPMEKLYQSKYATSFFTYFNFFRDKTLQKLLIAATEAFPSENSRQAPGSRKTGGEEDLVTITRSCSCRDELKQRLDSKSPLGNYIGRVFDASAVYMLANTWTVKYLFFHLKSSTKLLFRDHHIRAPSGRQREKYQNYLLRECCDTAELISVLAKYIPIVRSTTPFSI